MANHSPLYVALLSKATYKGDNSSPLWFFKQIVKPSIPSINICLYPLQMTEPGVGGGGGGGRGGVDNLTFWAGSFKARLS